MRLGDGMAISQLAIEVLRDHGKRPAHMFYDVDVLGPLFKDTELDRLDAAYIELIAAGLMESAGSVVSYFGAPKNLNRLTALGREMATTLSAA